MMKDKAIIVNTARGGIIDEEALLWALKENKIWGAGIDIFEEEPPSNHKLLELDNIIIGSHCAASTYEAIDNMGIMAAQNLIQCLEKSNIKEF
nr:NAD(P)-dependent oxidoreductase [Petroclostridium xylanilyticum]